MPIWLLHSPLPADRECSRLIYGECWSDCYVLAAPTESTWSVFWYLQNVNFNAAFLLSCRLYVMLFYSSGSRMSTWPLRSPPSCRLYVMSLGATRMLIRLLCSLPSCRKYVMSLDFSIMLFWLWGSPPSCRAYVILFDVSTMSIWLLGSPSSCRPCVISSYVCRLSIWLLRCHPPADCAWSLIMSAYVDLIAALSLSCRLCVISR